MICYLDSGSLKFDGQVFHDLVTFTRAGLHVPLAYIGTDIAFTNCQFRKGIKFDFDISNTPVQKLSFYFSTCIIHGTNEKSTILKSNIQKLDLFFSHSIMSDLAFEESAMSSFMVSNSLILDGRLLLNQCRIEWITFSNCLGSIFINDKGCCKVKVAYSDSNLFMERSGMFKRYKDIAKHKKLKNILLLKTAYYFNDLKEISVGYDLSNELPGFHYDPLRSSQTLKTSYKYRLRPIDRDLLDISLLINQQKGVTDKIKISKVILGYFGFTGASEAKVLIEHCLIDKIIFEEIRVKELMLYDVCSRPRAINTYFSIQNCNLSNTHFDKVNIRSYKTVNIYRSFVESLRFSSVSFPNIILTVENIHFPEKMEEDYMDMQYELYRQLKVALLANSNQVKALEMHKRMFNAIWGSKSLRGEDWFILLLNRLSNAHESSARRALFISFAAVILFWWVYCFYLPSCSAHFGWGGFGEWIVVMGECWRHAIVNSKLALVLANPVHTMGALKEACDTTQELSTANYAVSLISRIVVAWSFYQFVSAFRRFGKK